MEEANRAQQEEQAQKPNLINQTLISQVEKQPSEEAPPQERLSYDEPYKPKKQRHIQNFEIEQEGHKGEGGGYFHKEASGGVKKRALAKKKPQKHEKRSGSDDFKDGSSGSYDLES